MTARGDDGFITDERVLTIIPKNNATECRVSTKTTRNRKTKERQHFIDFREHWYRDGHLEEPLPTKKGTMIHRESIGKVCIAILTEMKSGEVSLEDIAAMRTQLKRLESNE